MAPRQFPRAEGLGPSGLKAYAWNARGFWWRGPCFEPEHSVDPGAFRCPGLYANDLAMTAPTTGARTCFYA